MAELSGDKLILGVSGHNITTHSVRSMMKQLRDHGVAPVFLSCYETDIALDVQRDMAWIDGLVVMGNDLDIDPRTYIDRYPQGDKRRCVHPQTLIETECAHGKKRACYEELMLIKALECGMPILGICGGMHRMNVLCGGTLHQHIPELVGSDKHMQRLQGIAPEEPVLPIIIKEDTRLADIASDIPVPYVRKEHKCSKVLMENSMHHQAIDIVASPFRVCAVTDSVRRPDGTNAFMAMAIEADPEGEFAGQFALGVQWHPEFGASCLGGLIVEELISETVRFKEKRPL